MDSYCLLQIDYASFHLSLLWVDSVLYITTYETMHNILFLLKLSKLKVINSQKTIKLIAVKFTAFVRLIIRAITTQKVLVTQSSNIVHCNWHSQKPTCAKFQGFSNTFSLLKFTYFIFLSGGVSLLHQCQCHHHHQQQQQHQNISILAWFRSLNFVLIN